MQIEKLLEQFQFVSRTLLASSHNSSELRREQILKPAGHLEIVARTLSA